jgi:hypothetical protein
LDRSGPNRVVDEVWAAFPARAGQPLVGLIDLPVEQVEVAVHLPCRQCRHGRQLVAHGGTADRACAGGLERLGVRPQRVGLSVALPVDANDRPEI